MSPAEQNIRLLKWFNFFTDFRPYVPVMPLYFAQVTGSYTLSATLLSIGAISATMFEVPTGMLADRMGRKWTAVAGVVIGALGITLDAAANSFLILVPASILIGLSYALYSGNQEALLYESLEDKDSYTAISGKVLSMFQLGLGASALFLALLASFVSLRTIFAISVIPQCVAFCIALRFVEPQTYSDRFRENIFSELAFAARLFVTNVNLRLLSFGRVISFGVGWAMFDLQAIFVALFWPTWAIGLGRFLEHLLGFAGAHTVGWWRTRMDDIRLLLTSQLIGKILSVTAFAYPTPMSPAILIADSYPWGASEVAAQSLLQRQFTDRQRATMGSLNALAGKLLLAISLLAIGWSADHFGIAQTLLACEILVTISIGFYWALFQREGKATDPA